MLTGNTNQKLSYSGTVKLYACQNNKKFFLGQYKNTGGSSLFDFFTQCLTGNFIEAAKLLPKQICLLNTTVQKEGGKEVVSLYEWVSQNSTKDISTAQLIIEPRTGYIAQRDLPVPVPQAGTAAVCFNFMVPASLIYDAEGIKDGINSVGLYTAQATEANDVDNFLALCVLNLNDYTSELAASSYMLLEWYLTIENQ